MKNTIKKPLVTKVNLTQFEAVFTPKSKTALVNFIKTASKSDLKKVGIGIFSNYKISQKDGENYLKPGEIHYLFPAKWFNFIPEGFPVIDIFGKKRKFSKKSSDDDNRYGYLSFGFIKKF